MDNFCPKCNVHLEDDYNFCPLCGEPLNALAKQGEQLKISNAILEKLNAIALSVKDPQVLETIKNYLL